MTTAETRLEVLQFQIDKSFKGVTLDFRLAEKNETMYSYRRWKGAGTIWISPKYLPALIKRRVARLSYWRARQAKYIFFFAHEIAHVCMNAIWHNEEAANVWAAKNYKKVCQHLSYSPKQTEQLWKSLPQHWRELA